MKAVIINKKDLIYNIQKIKEYANHTKQVQIIAVVKTNGYGLGIVEYTKFLINNGINFFAISTVEEALKLRKAEINKKLLMLSSTRIEEDIRILIKYNVILTIGSEESAQIVNKIGKELNKKIKVHVKIDTGLGRYGFTYNNIQEIITTLKNLNNIKIEGTFSHFSNSYYDDKYTKLQFERFMHCVRVLKRNNIETGILHICSTSAFIKFPNMYLDAIRIGSGFIGRVAFKNNVGLRKIGYLKSNVSEIKELPKSFNIGYSNNYKTKQLTKIAIIPCGYLDGVNIQNGKDMFKIIDKIRYIKDIFKHKALTVKINEQECLVLGRIGTCHITVDITGKNVKINDETVFSTAIKYVDSGIKRIWE